MKLRDLLPRIEKHKSIEDVFLDELNKCKDYGTILVKFSPDSNKIKISFFNTSNEINNYFLSPEEASALYVKIKERYNPAEGGGLLDVSATTKRFKDMIENNEGKVEINFTKKERRSHLGNFEITSILDEERKIAKIR